MVAKKTGKRSRKGSRKTRRRSVKRGGGDSATWPPPNDSFGAKIGSPANADNLAFEGGRRRRRTRRGGDPIPNRNQFEARSYEVIKKDSPNWKGVDTHKISVGQYDTYKKTPKK